MPLPRRRTSAGRGRSAASGDAPGRRRPRRTPQPAERPQEVSWLHMILLVAAAVAVVVIVFTLLGYVLGTILL